jgi:microcin C transport system permease protein
LKTKILKTELSQKRWKIFKSQKRSMISLWLFIVLTLFSFTAEIWCNSKPLVLSHNGNTYFPVFKTYHPTDFGITDTLHMDYRNFELGEEDWSIWPPIKWDPFQTNKDVTSYPSSPTGDNLLGTDDRGRDVFSRLIYGYRYSIFYAISVWFLSVILGTLFGGAMGFYGGRVDIIGQRLVEIFSTIPVLFLLIIIFSIYTPSILLLVVISGIFGWISISYYVRAEFLKNRKKEFVEAARAIGVGNFSILNRHILPNSLVPIVTFSPFMIAGYISGLSILDYLGFGLAPPTPSWGELLSQAKKHFMEAWWLAVYPSLALFMTLLFLVLIGDGVRSAFDPRKTSQ